MDWARNRKNSIYLFGFFLIILFLTSAHGQEKAGVSSKELEEVVDLIEDPQKREAFIRDLKNIIQVKEEVVNKSEKETGSPAKRVGVHGMMGSMLLLFLVLDES